MKEQALAQFGLKLQEARIKKKIELEQVANQTRININFLKKMEAGQFDFLPEFYVRNFLKLYLQCLGQNAAEFLHEYDQLQRKEEPPVTTVTDEDLKAFVPSKGFASQLADLIAKIKPYVKQLRLLGVIAAAAIVLILLVIVLRQSKPTQAIQESPTVTVVPESSRVVADSLPKPATVIQPQTDRLHLELKGLQRTWLQITVDDSAAQEHIFDAGMTHRWYGKDRFRLLIGNGAGIRLFLNGKDLGPLGQTGQVVRFQVTENGIEKDAF